MRCERFRTPTKSKELVLARRILGIWFKILEPTFQPQDVHRKLDTFHLEALTNVARTSPKHFELCKFLQEGSSTELLTKCLNPRGEPNSQSLLRLFSLITHLRKKLHNLFIKLWALIYDHQDYARTSLFVTSRLQAITSNFKLFGTFELSQDAVFWNKMFGRIKAQFKSINLDISRVSEEFWDSNLRTQIIWPIQCGRYRTADTIWPPNLRVLSLLKNLE